ncbi:hypothetical protein ACKVMT_06690 [Halobacteriales archaeon Cl-PHB]
MSSLPFAPTAECRRCGAPTRPDRNQFTLAPTPAYDEICTGNLCDNCFAEVMASLE